MNLESIWGRVQYFRWGEWSEDEDDETVDDDDSGMGKDKGNKTDGEYEKGKGIDIEHCVMF